MTKDEKIAAAREAANLIRVALGYLDQDLERQDGDIDPYGTILWRLIDAAGLIASCDGVEEHATGRFELRRRDIGDQSVTSP